MRPVISLRIVLPGDATARGEAAAIDLLQAVDRLGSLQQAAQALDLSYRHAWGLLKHWEDALGEPLLHSVRGRGAVLAPAGRRLVEAPAALQAEAAPSLAAWNARLQALFPGTDTSPAQDGKACRPLRLASVPDGLLADWLATRADPALPLSATWCDAAEALARLHDGQADLAGFGVGPLYLRGSLPHVTLRRWLHPRQVALLRVATRPEGLVLARTRPLPVRQLAAVVRAGLRLCNRPPASASRWLLDLCLDRERIPPAQVRGYDDVVPARDEALERLRSGQADMMWGTPDLARRHGWQFLPLTAQTLYLATRTGGVPPAAWQALRRELSGREFAALAQRHPDHDLTGTGQRLRAAEALPWHRGAAVHMQVHADDDDCASPAQSGAFPPGAPRS